MRLVNWLWDIWQYIIHGPWSKLDFLALRHCQVWYLSLRTTRKNQNTTRCQGHIAISEWPEKIRREKIEFTNRWVVIPWKLELTKFDKFYELLQISTSLAAIVSLRTQKYNNTSTASKTRNTWSSGGSWKIHPRTKDALSSPAGVTVIFGYSHNLLWAGATPWLLW